MSLIINDKLQMMMEGYPTVSDKYNVVGGILEGDAEVEFGRMVQYGATTGYYKAVDANAIENAGDAAKKLAGFVLATNVKLNTVWPEGGANVKAGEAFNLLLNGFIAVPLATTAIANDIVANGVVKVTANGELTTVDDDAAKDTLANCVFTGMHEKHGDVIIAEIFVK